jgi:hypothetical protein
VEPADSAKDSEPLEPEYLTNWARFLTAQKEVDGSPFRVWWKVRAGEAIEPKTPLETALIADLTPAEIDLPHLWLNESRTSTNSLFRKPRRSRP